MLLVDQNKAVIVGKLDTVVKELAFLVDKLSEQGNEQGDISSEKVMDLFYEEVAGFQKDRERGVSRDHPHDEDESLNSRDSRDNQGRGNKKERATAAEAALIEAMKEIQEMRVEKEKALKKKKNKKNKKEK